MGTYMIARDCLCQTCNRFFTLPEVMISTVINMDTIGYEVDKYNNNTINRVKCDKCMSEFTFETRLVVFSYQKRYAVYVNPDSDFKAQDSSYAPDILFPDGFYFREVNYLIEAREKLNILRDGLSDIFIEKLKKDYFSDEDTSPFNLINMIYTHHDKNTYYFTKYDFNENPIGEYKIEYTGCKDKFNINLRTDRWIRVNRFTIDNICKGDQL